MIDQETIAHHGQDVLAMMQSPGWKFFCEMVFDKIGMTMEQAIGDEPANLLYHRGSIDGMKAAVLTATDIVNIMRDVSGERRDVRKQMADAGLSTL